jgi:hypothetical protein
MSMAKRYSDDFKVWVVLQTSHPLTVRCSRAKAPTIIRGQPAVSSRKQPFFEQLARMLAGLRLMHFIGDQLTTIDILDHVPVKNGPNCTGPSGDISPHHT